MNTTSKAIMAVAIVAVLAIAAVGVGLAYTAQTDNSANKADNTYLTLSQTSMTGDLGDNKIAWNSVQTAGVGNDSKVTVAYYMDSGIDKTTGKKVAVQDLTVGEGTKKVIKVGELTIAAKSSEAISSFTFKIVNPEKGAGVTSTKLKADTGVLATNITTGEDSENNVIYTYYVGLAYSGTGMTVDSGAKALDVSKSAFTDPGATFTFTKTSDAVVVDGNITVSLYVEQVDSTAAEKIVDTVANLKPVDFNTSAGFEIDFQAEVEVPVPTP